MKKITIFFYFVALCLGSNAYAQDSKFFEGKWDMVVEKDGKQLPSWLEIKHSGSKTLVGRFVSWSGSARPISEVKAKDGKFSFTIPPQWAPDLGDLTIKGAKDGEGLKGTLAFAHGETYDWTAVRAPKLTYVENPKWGQPIELFNGKDLSGWKALGKNQWVVEDGILKSPKSGANLVTEEKFQDFKLHVEFKVPPGSNSGVYLRGRYEVQITDDHGSEPSNVLFGGIYGFLTPNEMAANPASEWQTYDITLIGRRVTVVANGKTIISGQNIPGITGGALDSKEGEPGPFYIQGDHGPIMFRKFTVTPRID
ncbi:3-keto-disaccharide hydrolase [Pseudozobellia thermophila]|uniref:3-keto-alpha-glucoside-1,2-lyase/3-keto-2-hydroxy-glucal hydratase domain-containing protein n=1 Tax=Pseudozobellia thermophila TaxID=192903 RepID=A0A1M6F462_9FLAO|nr:DUF1080 domain-containing protein [Pseudozobellia thermophila]SHI92446.1 protein of unknown function [Pseudozobellia thermophila]